MDENREPYSIGHRITVRLQDSYAEWVRGHGPGHAQRWMDTELWPDLGQMINDAVLAEHKHEDKTATQPELS